MIYIGIDPGKHGAIASVAGASANVWDTPIVLGQYHGPSMVAMIELARRWAGTGPTCTVIEGGRIMPTRVKRGSEWVDTHQSAKALAEQWRGIGLWEGILMALRVPYDVVPPAKWKRELGVTADKQTSIDKARELFPSAAHLVYRKRDDGRAEALLLAEYGRRVAGAL